MPSTTVLRETALHPRAHFPLLRTAGLWSVSRLSWNWRKRSSIKISERTYEEGTEAFHTRRKSSHLEAASCGQSTCLGAVCRIRPAANNVPPLAERTVRERSRRFSVSRASPPPSGGEAETDRVLGEEGADQGRGPG